MRCKPTRLVDAPCQGTDSNEVADSESVWDGHILAGLGVESTIKRGAKDDISNKGVGQKSSALRSIFLSDWMQPCASFCSL